MYIGSAVNIRRRWNDHRSRLNLSAHRSQKLQRAYIKYGAAAFEFAVLELIEDRADLVAVEQTYIDFFDASGRGGYNSRPIARSNLGLKRTPEQIARMSEVATGRVFTPEHRANIAAAGRGYVRSQESRAKQSAQTLGKKKSPTHCANISAGQRGKTIPPEQVAKMLETRATNKILKGLEALALGLPIRSQKGKEHTIERRANISRAMTGRKQSPEQIAAAQDGKLFAKILRGLDARIAAAEPAQRTTQVAHQLVAQASL
jgi:group I intron endonuclease